MHGRYSFFWTKLSEDKEIWLQIKDKEDAFWWHLERFPYVTLRDKSPVFLKGAVFVSNCEHCVGDGLKRGLKRGGGGEGQNWNCNYGVLKRMGGGWKAKIIDLRKKFAETILKPSRHDMRPHASTF